MQTIWYKVVSLQTPHCSLQFICKAPKYLPHRSKFQINVVKMRFMLLPVLSTKFYVFWDVAPFSLVEIC
jgi:hypothetical protein